MNLFGKAVDSPICSIAPWLGVITSLQEQVEYSIRVSSLTIGLIIGLVHLWRLLFKE
jgi:hypothetical protein